MDFAGINYLAVVVAAIVSFFIGWPWYMTFGKTWARAVGLDPDNPPGPKPKPFVVLGIALLVMAWVLAGVIGHLGSGQVTIRNGIISGLFVWLGFVVAPMAVNYTFQDRKPVLTLIDGGHFLLVLIVMGAIIGWFGA
ncbi:MAG: DUF1761 domain-containing protein [Hyphomicrobiaceae bacterium]|nr:DUF1761 domain-containing protein [Hyphomicrobiaceae bacterium]